MISGRLVPVEYHHHRKMQTWYYEVCADPGPRRRVNRILKILFRRLLLKPDRVLNMFGTTIISFEYKLDETQLGFSILAYYNFTFLLRYDLIFNH